MKVIKEFRGNWKEGSKLRYFREYEGKLNIGRGIYLFGVYL